MWSEDVGDWSGGSVDAKAGPLEDHRRERLIGSSVVEGGGGWSISSSAVNGETMLRQKV